MTETFTRPAPEESASPEHRTDDPVVSHNLDMMHSGAFTKVFMNESIGGNAGRREVNGIKFVCAGINGYADQSTGLIKAFGNFQNLPPEVVAENGYIGLTVGLSLAHPEAGNPILEVQTDGSLSAEALDRIQAAIDRYNQEEPARAAAAMEAAGIPPSKS